MFKVLINETKSWLRGDYFYTSFIIFSEVANYNFTLYVVGSYEEYIFCNFRSV